MDDCLAININHDPDIMPKLRQICPISGPAIVLDLYPYRIIHHPDSLVKGDRPSRTVSGVVNRKSHGLAVPGTLPLDYQQRKVVQILGGELADVVDYALAGGAGLPDIDGVTGQAQAFEVG